MAEYNLRNAHVSCLYYLYLESSVTATELVEKCEEDKATISRAVDCLERNGFIIPRPKNKKRYKTPLQLTEKGKEAGKKISTKIDLAIDRLHAQLPREDLDHLYRTLSAISDILDAIGKNYDQE